MIDALGREVPEWAREAFAILSADGRRVFVGGFWSDPHYQRRDGDARIHETRCAQIVVDVDANCITAHGTTLAIAAWREAMRERERGR